MFSNKEFLICGVSIGFGITYMICKISYEAAKALSKQDVTALREFMIACQVAVLCLYLMLIFVFVLMQIKSRRFMKNSVKENFQGSQWLFAASEMLACIMAISLILALFDGFYFLNLWLEDPATALKLSFFFYWLYKVVTDNGAYLAEYSVMWQIPLCIFVFIFGFSSYKIYFTAKRRFNNLFPSIPDAGIYNAFSTRKRKEDAVVFIAPTDILSEPECDENDESSSISPLKKPLGNNSLFSVDQMPKEKTILKTQAEIDAEDENFFAGSAENGEKEYSLKTSFSDDTQGEGITFSEAEDELVPDGVVINVSKSDDKELIPCSLCGYLNFNDNKECSFCGALMPTKGSENDNNR